MDILEIFSYKKVMLLSLREEYFDQILARTKLFEFRKKFPYEEIVAIIYISKTKKHIAGILELGLPFVGTSEEVAEFAVKHNEGTYEETLEYLGHNKQGYAMPVDKIYVFDKPISWETLKQIDAKFLPPQSYSYLKDGSALYNYLLKTELSIRKI